MDFAKLLAKLDSIESKKNLNEGWDDMMKGVKDREKEKGTGKFDKKKVSTGTVYTKKAEKEHGEESDELKKSKKKVKEAEQKVDEDDVEEGNEFSGAMAKAKAAGKKEFTVGGKTYPVKESEEKDDDKDGKKPDFLDVDKDGDKEESMSKALKDKEGKDKDDDDDDDDDKDDDKKKVDESLVADGQIKWATMNVDRFVNHYTAKGKTVQEALSILYKTSHERARKLAESKKMSECYDQAMGQQDSGMNISSSVDTQSGSKSMTVSARGEAAEQLAQILKLSGLVGHSQAMKPEVEVSMEEGEYANEPAPVVQGVDAILKQGNDLNRPKGTYPKVAGGDNPMAAMMEDKELKILESRLMKELDNIKSQDSKKKQKPKSKEGDAIKEGKQQVNESKQVQIIAYNSTGERLEKAVANPDSRRMVNAVELTLSTTGKPILRFTEIGGSSVDVFYADWHPQYGWVADFS